ncbi:hypothetical protein H5410_031547 [Solanum commersonii]|uniref:Uncharacterized protein n=1 Tax=Solanum commersonii TaxID=4109 RepID=A0A9J5YIN8_SOLCO|nr:hypothetical protein H5410_031547 [Solanum commersonii]
MAQNEIEEMLDHLRRIKSGGNLSSFKIDQIEKLEMVLRVFKNFMKYHHVLLPDSLVKLTKKAKLTMKMLQLLFRRIPKVQKANHNLERLESYLLEFFEGKTSLSYNYEKNDFDLSKYMDCLGNNLNDVLMMLLEGVMSDSPEEKLAIHRFIKQLKIVQKKMSFLRYLYATEINGNVNEEKLECLETQIQFMANNVVQLCHAVSVNVVADFVNDKDEFDRYEYDIFNKPPYLLCLIVLVELEMKKIFLSELKASKFTQSRTFKGKKLPKGFSHHLHSLLMYLRNKKLEIFPNSISAQNIDVAIEFMLVFLDADVSNHVISGKWLNEVMEKAGAIAGNLEEELSVLTSILEKELSSLSSIFIDVAKRELLQDIFSQVTDSEDKGDKDDVLADMLRKNLIGKRYIIVLDDMWGGMAWEDLRLSFPDVGNRSRIIVTTRLEKVGEQVMHYIDPYHLPSLETKESCQLLQRKVFQKEDCPPELQDVSQAVAEKCKGLPLVVVLLAGIIKKRKMEKSWWNEVKDALFDYLDRELEEYSLVTMQLSFDNLPHCLKPCLLYMGMFPEDTRIPVSKLISVWTAEGFVQNIESAEDYLMDLISSNVVMVSKKSYDGKVKICQVHDVVRHFCLDRSREENFMLAVKGNASQFQPVDWKGSRVSFSFSEEHSKFGSLGSKTRKPFHQHLRSLITTNGGIFYNWNPFYQISELRLVKVLDLSSHRVDRFSSATLKPLNHLKYLAVWADKFYFHPESHLPHIETLFLKNLIPDTDLDNKVVLPVSFWEMKKLWHVEIRGSLVVKNNAEFDKHGLFEGSSKLENLRYLRRVVIDETDSVDVLVSRCPNLQQLHITFDDNYPSAKLEDLTHLQILHLSFRWSHCPSVLQLPLNLKKLVLFGIRIESTIPFIAGPSSLEYLQLQNLYFPRSKEWCLGDITFPNLKLLKLVNLDISRWDASEESFPLLETLVIQRCERLKDIPLGFADISTLKQIMLIRCQNNALEASAVKLRKKLKLKRLKDATVLISLPKYMANIMDTNEEERVKGITVEVGRAPFEIETMRFTILDALVTFYPHSFSGLPCTREEKGTEIQLGLALESQNATLSVKRRLACEAVRYYAQTLCCLSGDNNFHGTAKKHLLFIKWKYLEVKVNSEHSLAEAIV